MSEQVVKKTVKLEWKAFPVSLPAFEAWCRENAAACCGCSAGAALEVHLTEDDQEQVAAIEAKWEEIEDAEHEMAAAYVSAADVASMKQALKVDAAAKTWNQLSGVQRKLIMGVDVSDAEAKAAHDALGA